MFGLLPRTRAIENASSIAFKLENVTPQMGRKLENDPRIQTTRMKSHRWHTLVLDSGRVEFQIGRDERTSPAGFMLKKGEVFGWAALLENQPNRIASARVLEKSVLLRINGKQALTILEADPASGYVVMRRLSALIAHYETAGAPKGEIVIVVGPPEEEGASAEDVDTLLRRALASMSVKDAAATVAAATGAPKRAIYARALELQGEK